MDNLGSNKSARLRRAAMVSGSLLARPQSHRTGLRKNQTLDAAGLKRAVEETWRQIGRLSEGNQPDECASHPANAGYVSVKT